MEVSRMGLIEKMEKEEESSKDAFERWSNGLFGSSMERYHPSIHEWWVEGLDLSENSKVLDAGCGAG